MKEEAVYLRHILECLGAVDSYTLDGREAFLSDLNQADLDLQELQFTHEQSISDIIKIEVGMDEIPGEFSQEENISKVRFETLLKLDEGDELVISLN